MAQEDLRRLLGLAGDEGVDQLVVLFGGDVVGHRIGEQHVAVGDVPQPAHQARDLAGGPGLEQHPVEVPVDVGEAALAVVAGRRALEGVERRPQPGDVLGTGLSDGAPQHRWLDDPAQVVDVVELLQRHVGRDDPAVRDVDHEPLSLEAPDRLGIGMCETP